MSLDHDDALPTDDLPAPTIFHDSPDEDEEDDEPYVPQPLVVIQYRNRGIPPFLIPPLLVVIAAGFILARPDPQRAPWPTTPAAPAAAPAPAPTPAPAPSEPPGPAVAPVALPPDPQPAPAPTVAAPASIAEAAPPQAAPSETLAVPEPTAREILDPLEGGEPKPARAEPAPASVLPASPFELNGDDGLRPVHPAPPRATPRSPVSPKRAHREDDDAPEPHHAPRIAIGFTLPADESLALPPAPAHSDSGPVVATREEIEADIQREAEARLAERAALTEIKDQAQVREVLDAVARAERQRAPFRNALRQILKTSPPDQASDLIDDLCEQYGRTALPQVRQTVLRKLGTSNRLDRDQSIAVMRRYGLPEPMILDHLAHELHRQTLNTREGPRDEDEVRIRAAYHLLSSVTRQIKN